tara:strand:+ start:6523 stop:6714 length:192 start_codon:yes stop_codon:yes gene_type:complete
MDFLAITVILTLWDTKSIKSGRSKNTNIRGFTTEILGAQTRLTKLNRRGGIVRDTCISDHVGE